MQNESEFERQLHAAKDASRCNPSKKAMQDVDMKPASGLSFIEPKLEPEHDAKKGKGKRAKTPKKTTKNVVKRPRAKTPKVKSEPSLRQPKNKTEQVKLESPSSAKVKSELSSSKCIVKKAKRAASVPKYIHRPFFESLTTEERLGYRETNKIGLIRNNLRPANDGSYYIAQVLGSGMIGVACLCNEENMRGVRCLKHMSQDKIKDKNLFKNIIDEVSIMYELIGVPGVCQIEDLIINENRDITIVLPFFSLTDLWNYMKVKPGRHLTEKDTRIVFRQLVHTFIGIHERRIMHRDIKPENILVKNEQLEVCISDFGLATRVGPQPQYEKTRTGQAGTPCYYSYEIIRKLPYDERVDIWCLGVLLFEMLFGALPFSHAPGDPRDYSASISSLQFQIPAKSQVSQEARDLIKRILVPQERRIKLKEILTHEWLELDLDLVF